MLIVVVGNVSEKVNYILFLSTRTQEKSILFRNKRDCRIFKEYIHLLIILDIVDNLVAKIIKTCHYSIQVNKNSIFSKDVV